MMELIHRWPLDDTATRDQLFAAYQDPKRGYHNLKHLVEVFERLYMLAASGIFWDMMPVTLATFFHDAVYDAGADNNEARSAEWARGALTQAGVDMATVTEVVRLVLLTRHHSTSADDVNGAAFCDADLGILAVDERRYADYVGGLHHEYAHLGDAAFIHGRLQVLHGLRTRDPLFVTAPGRGLWQAAAYANIDAEMETLQGLMSSDPAGGGRRRAAEGGRRAAE